MFTLPQPTFKHGIEVIDLGRVLGKFECCDCKTVFSCNDYEQVNVVYIQQARKVYGGDIIPDKGYPCAYFLPECPMCGAIATSTLGNVQL